MRAKDFFTGKKGDRRLCVGLLEQLRREPLPDTRDVDVAISLLRLVRTNLDSVARADRPEDLASDDDIALVLKVLRAVLGRVGVEPPDLPFRDYASLQSVFIRNGWRYALLRMEERVLFVADLLEPVAARLAVLEEEEFQRTLAEPVSSQAGVDWRQVDDEIAGLRSAFAAASNAQQYSNVGNICVRILETVGEIVHDPARHLRDGEPPLARDKVKERLIRFIEAELAGADNAELRRLARAAVESAHRQKHRREPGRREVGITADAVVLVVSILRRLAGHQQEKSSMHA